MRGLFFKLISFLFLATSFQAFAAGGLKTEEVKDVIRKHINEIRRCYEKYLDRSPAKRNGLIKLSFTIGLTGSVDKVSIVESDFSEKDIKVCVLKEISTWKFPKPRGNEPVVVTYPFNFSDPGMR